MVYGDDSQFRAKSEMLINARRWGIGIITSLLGIGMIASEVSRVRALWPDVMVISYVTLFALTGVLVWLWIWATDNELKIMWRWLDPDRYRPPQSMREVSIIAGLAVVLSALFYASRNPLLYAIAFTAYNLATLFSTKYLDRQIDKAIDKSRKRLQSEMATRTDDKRLQLYAAGSDIIEHYFRRRPQRRRHVLILVAGIVAVLCGVVYHRTGKTALGVSSYAIAFLTITISEIVIAAWRTSRDDALEPIEEELNELERAAFDAQRAASAGPTRP